MAEETPIIDRDPGDEATAWDRLDAVYGIPKLQCCGEYGLCMTECVERGGAGIVDRRLSSDRCVELPPIDRVDAAFANCATGVQGLEDLEARLGREIPVPPGARGTYQGE